MIYMSEFSFLVLHWKLDQDLILKIIDAALNPSVDVAIFMKGAVFAQSH